MIIGVPKEIKVHEYRVGLTPESVRALADNEHLRNGLNVCRGAVTQREVAQARGYPYTESLRALRA